MGILSFSEAKNDPSKIIAAELTSGSLLDGGNAGGATFNNNGAIADSPNLPVNWSISAPDQALLESSFYLQFEVQSIGATDGSNPIADGVLLQGNGAAFSVVGGDFNDWRSLLHPIFTEILRFGIATHKGDSYNGALRTYPSFSPRGGLDRIYYRGPIRALTAHTCRLRLSRVASDHLPVIADFDLH